MDKIWLKQYPAGTPAEINADRYASIPELLAESCSKFADFTAFTHMGFGISYRELDQLSARFAAFLQNDLGMKKGDRIAIQLPNLLQFPIALFGALRAGMVVVNTNPLYTEREMKHQFRDSGATAIVILANFCDKLEKILPETSLRHVIVTEIGDAFPFAKRTIVNFMVKNVKRMVPSFNLKQQIRFNDALARGASGQLKAPSLSGSDLAFLQYTGGTTGVSKGAMLTHRNIVANLEQIYSWITKDLDDGEVVMTPLPLYHIFSLTVNCLAFAKRGANMVLVTNPRDLPALIAEIKKTRPTAMSVVNTLVNAMINKSDLDPSIFKTLKITVAGGMALQTTVAQRWMDITGTKIAEGYGLTECSPVVSCNPINGKGKLGTIGLPLPSTDIRLIDEDGKEVGMGEVGELCVRGPQVMKGYWEHPEETRQVLDSDGWLKTGDMAMMADDGYFQIVDRKKDMILVSGFNVYPNEIEEVVASNPKVLEVAAVGVEDEHSGEAVKVFVVKKDSSLTADELKSFCKKSLTGYKLPREVAFVNELPKNNVGKILRRLLREPSPSASAGNH